MRKEISQRVIGFITAAFGLVAGLAWNDAVRSLIEFVFPLKQNSLWAKFIYAFILTFILVMVTIYLARLFREKSTRDDDS